MKLHFCWTHPGLENTYTQLLFKEGIQYYKKEFNCFKWVKLFYLRLSAHWRDDVPQDTSWLNKKGIFILKKRLQWGKIQIKCCKTPGMFCGNFTQLSHQHDGEQMMTKYIKCVCCLSCLIVTGFLHRYAFLTLSHYYIMSVAQIK